jgi:hypothetical protein
MAILTVDIPDATAEKLEALQRIWHVSPAEAITWLVARHVDLYKWPVQALHLAPHDEVAAGLYGPHAHDLPH